MANASVWKWKSKQNKNVDKAENSNMQPNHCTWMVEIV